MGDFILLCAVPLSSSSMGGQCTLGAGWGVSIWGQYNPELYTLSCSKISSKASTHTSVKKTTCSTDLNLEALFSMGAMHTAT